MTFTDGTRGGLLGQASVLTVTSYPNRTSVTMRGRWVLANLLGAPPPPPPPDIPALEEAGTGGQPRSLRERMEVHRKNPACASCHQRMDPLGFALENFDALGKWRDGERRRADRCVGVAFPTARGSTGSPGLRALLVSHKEDFVRTLTGKLLAYAIGRGLDHHDMPAIRKIARDAAAVRLHLVVDHRPASSRARRSAWRSLRALQTRARPRESGTDQDAMTEV